MKVEHILSGKEEISCNPIEVLKIMKRTDKIDPSKLFTLARPQKLEDI